MNRYILDTECYIDYFLLMIRCVDTQQVFSAEMYLGKPLGVSQLPEGVYITFNGSNYDMPLLSLAFAGCDNATLKKVSDDIILRKYKPWHIEQDYGVKKLDVKHIDLIEVAPGQVGLKTYGGRIHSERLQDLPIDPSASITVDDRELLKTYCANDLQTTLDLFNFLQPQLLLREQMSAKYGLDLMSKSDAQIAEAIIKLEVEKLKGKRIYKPKYAPDYKFRYKVPDVIKFISPGLNHVLNIIRNSLFTLDETGHVQMPPILDGMRVTIGQGIYTLGIGGLHSCEHGIAHETALIDRDVRSYYPSIILQQGLSPVEMGESFLVVLENILTARLQEKDTGNKVVADTLKIVINSMFGHFGNQWSYLYAPELMLQVTLSGQLMLLMLIELLELNGVQVVSANTDGVVFKAHGKSESIITNWEALTGMVTEETHYSALYSRDVNNYVAVKTNGEVKTKGAYATNSIQKNPTNNICVEAAIKYLQNKINPMATLLECKDVRKFVTIRKVEGGGEYKGNYLGKTVRWYYKQGEEDTLKYANKGSIVPRSKGAFPIMQIPDKFPEDIDYFWYFEETLAILKDVGVTDAIV